MVQAREKMHSAQVALHSGASVSAAWQNVVLPWFTRVSKVSWQQPNGAAIIIPSRSHTLFFRKLLLEHEIALLGVHFLTPTALRNVMRNGTKILSPETLRLLLSIVAEEGQSLAAAKSIASAPDYLLRAIEQLGAAGCNFEEVGPPDLSAIAKRFRKLVQHSGFELKYEADRAANIRASSQSPLFTDVLIAGFDGAHWSLWFLLQAAVHASERATVLLTDPRDEARDLDEAWIGTWEEKFGSATPVEAKFAQNETLFPELFETNPCGRNGSTTLAAKTHFLVGRDVTEQAKAIVALVRHFLATDALDRIGVLFPSTGALPRMVASLLTEAEIAHNDSIAHLAPGPLDDEAWHAWLELQENPRLRIFCRFVRAMPDLAQLFDTTGADQIEDTLRDAYRDLLIDDLGVLREYCAQRSNSPPAQKVGLALKAIRFLPERATITEYLGNTREIFLQLKWTERWRIVEQASACWSKNLTNGSSRATYLRWLAEIGASLFPLRDPMGDHPYSRVQLLFYSQAEGQNWSHLIFTGCSEGSWPPRADESGFLSDEEIEAFNQSVRRLNRRVVRQGRQGEGHTVVAEGKTFCLGSSERLQLAERQFRNLVELATAGIGVTANLVEETAPERLANPSEFFTQLYYEARSEALSQTTMATLHNQTRDWLDKEYAHEKPAPSTDVQQTNIAYTSRHAPNQPFREYEFALREPPTSAAQLSATAWERAIKTPALVWMEKFLGIAATDDEFADWNLATGQWVHRWLRQIAARVAEGHFVARPDSAAIHERVSAAAICFRDDVAALLAKCDRQLPDWWLSGWKRAASIADCLTAIVARTEDWSHFATEWTLPPHSIRFADNEYLSIKGRIDLLLARGECPNETVPFADLWVVDYKTGTRKSLARKRYSQLSAEQQLNLRLRKGHGIQLALYALALHELGASEIAVSLLTRDLELDRPQIGIKEIIAQQEIWRELARMAATGIFGMRGPIRSEFAFQNPYPLATLSIDPDLLEEKWSRTYPALTRPEMDE